MSLLRDSIELATCLDLLENEMSEIVDLLCELDAPSVSLSPEQRKAIMSQPDQKKLDQIKSTSKSTVRHSRTHDDQKGHSITKMVGRSPRALDYVAAKDKNGKTIPYVITGREGENYRLVNMRTGNVHSVPHRQVKYVRQSDATRSQIFAGIKHRLNPKAKLEDNMAGEKASVFKYVRDTLTL